MTVTRHVAELISDVAPETVRTGSHGAIKEFRFRIFGTISGDLVVEEGAVAELNGRVSGNVYAVGRTMLRPGAVVTGRLIGPGFTPAVRRHV